MVVQLVPEEADTDGTPATVAADFPVVEPDEGVAEPDEGVAEPVGDADAVTALPVVSVEVPAVPPPLIAWPAANCGTPAVAVCGVAT